MGPLAVAVVISLRGALHLPEPQCDSLSVRRLEERVTLDHSLPMFTLFATPVVIIEEHSGFGRYVNSRVIYMIKPVNVETWRSTKEIVHRLR